ncbi:MAG TPA: IS1 family transposase [Bacteroidota bacterium]|nr:IS1 family transposase [Bacteroidota bacterium]
MNRLPIETQALILSQLVEGNSIRSIERVTGVHRDTILRLLKEAGEIASEIMDTQMQNLEVKRLQVDEIWTYVAKKQKLVTKDDSDLVGDQYIFVALDADTKLIPSFLVGKRTLQFATSFMYDLKNRIRTRFQLSTDALAAYTEAVDFVFGSDIDYGMVHKTYQTAKGNKAEIRYSPGHCTGVHKKPIIGEPTPRHISTSLVERQNLTMRMNMRRFTRLTNGFSKKFDNLRHALALHFFHYNFMRIHESLRVTPAMEAKITSRLWSWYDFLTYNDVRSEAA